MENQQKNWYDKYYKIILIIPALVLIFSVAYLVYFYNAEGDIIKKDVSITGGTSITVFDEKVDIDGLKIFIEENFPDASIKELSNIRTGGQRGFIIETRA